MIAVKSGNYPQLTKEEYENVMNVGEVTNVEIRKIGLLPRNSTQ